MRPTAQRRAAVEKLITQEVLHAAFGEEDGVDHGESNFGVRESGRITGSKLDLIALLRRAAGEPPPAESEPFARPGVESKAALRHRLQRSKNRTPVGD